MENKLHATTRCGLDIVLSITLSAHVPAPGIAAPGALAERAELLAPGSPPSPRPRSSRERPGRLSSRSRASPFRAA